MRSSLRQTKQQNVTLFLHQQTIRSADKLATVINQSCGGGSRKCATDCHEIQMNWLARHHRPPQTKHANGQPVVCLWQLIFKGGCNKMQFDLSVKCHRSKRLAMQRTEVLTLNFKLARTFNNAVPTISWQDFVSAQTETHRRENVIDLASSSLKPFMKIYKNLKENVGLPLL